MEGTPRYLDYSAILETFLQIDGVVRVHNLRIWALSVNKIALAAHLAVGKCFSSSFCVFSLISYAQKSKYLQSFSFQRFHFSFILLSL